MSSALKSKRDQAFLIDPRDAMDAMPNKRLVADTLEADGQFCTLGVLSAKRSIEMSVIDAHCRETVSGAFRIAPAMAAEVVFENDECGWNETSEQRWQRMRKWIGSHIKEVTP